MDAIICLDDIESKKDMQLVTEGHGNEAFFFSVPSVFLWLWHERRFNLYI